MNPQDTMNYREAGNHHPDTVDIQDGFMLNPTGTNKITGIKGWQNNFVIGLEIFYNGNTMGPKIGKQDNFGMQMVEFSLQPGEEITTINGRHGNIIDQVTFVTSMGRNFTVGTSYGGNPFSLSVPGYVVGKIRFGINGHVHYIGAVFRMPMNSMGQQFPSQPMNMNYSQPMNMPMNNQMYGAPFNNQSATNPMYPNMSMSMSMGMPNTSFMTTMNTMMIQPSIKVGGINPDTIAFDDYNSVLMPLIQQGKYVEISDITIISNHQNVFGIKIEYRVIDQSGNHVKIEQKHHGTAEHFQHHSVQHHKHKFHDGEQITEIYGRSGAIIDQLFIKTSHGKTIGGGGQGGNPFMIPLPPGRRFFAFAGGTNGHLHNLYVYHSP